MTDAIYTTDSEFLPVAEVTVLPDSVGQTMCGNDIALVRLATPLDGIAPIALQVATAPAVGEGFTAIGYGVSKRSNLDSSGIRRSRAGLAVTDVGETDRTTDGEWIADAGPCGGDSGSPALDANGASFGVMTRGKKSTCTSMVYERIDVHADFLVEQARASADRLGVAPPDWAGGAGGAGSGATTGAGGARDADAPEHGSSGCSVGSGRGSVGGLGVLAMAIAWLGARRRTR